VHTDWTEFKSGEIIFQVLSVRKHQHF